MAVPRIDANAVSFPRMMLLSRVQPKFKDCAQAGGAGPSLSQRQVSPRGWATNYCPSLLWALHAKLSGMKETYRIY